MGFVLLLQSTGLDGVDPPEAVGRLVLGRQAAFELDARRGSQLTLVPLRWRKQTTGGCPSLSPLRVCARCQGQGRRARTEV